MKKFSCTSGILLLILSVPFAQKENAAVRNGNRFYKQNSYGQAASEYKKAVTQKPDHAIANYNLGNALFRTNKLEEAVNSYESAAGSSEEITVKEQAFYNKGVAYSKQQKLMESIEAWKNALKLDATDTEARENLQKALLELKKQQPDENQQKDKQEKNKQDKQQQQEQPQQQSKLNKKQVEQLLKALSQKEKEVQQKMQSANSSPSKQEKDW